MATETHGSKSPASRRKGKSKAKDGVQPHLPKGTLKAKRKAKMAKQHTETPKATARPKRLADPNEEEAVMNQATTQLNPEMTFFRDQYPTTPAGPSRLPATPSSFTPLTRSILAGYSADLSYSPPKRRSQTLPKVNGGEATAEGSSDAIGEHFQPPSLFSASLDPELSVVEKNGGIPPGSESSKGRVDGTEVLLLPDNVMLSEEAQEAGEEGVKEPPTPEGVHFLDDNRSRGAQRYFDPSAVDEDSFLAKANLSMTCSNCKRPGHRGPQCPHIICSVCGAEDEHERRDCPHSLVCFRCGERGHSVAQCTNAKTNHSRDRACDQCGSRGHQPANCPSFWRIYAYWSADERDAEQSRKLDAKGWAKEAIGGHENDLWCYNCAMQGHLGDDCLQFRRSVVKLSFASAFSDSVCSRGPFTRQKKSTRAGVSSTPTHSRWDDEDHKLPDASPGFGGANAGKKTREKAVQKLVREEQRFSGSEEEDWFSGNRRSGGMSIRGRAKAGPSTFTPPHRNGNSNAGQRSAGGGNSGSRLPFSHTHLLSSAPEASRGKTFSFGKLSLPDNAASPTPPVQANGKKNNVNPLLARALTGLTRAEKSQPRHGEEVDAANDSPQAKTLAEAKARSARRNKRKMERTKRQEIEELTGEKWYESGHGGGNVADWGSDIDSPSSQRNKKKIKEGNSGQQYTGGY